MINDGQLLVTEVVKYDFGHGLWSKNVTSIVKQVCDVCVQGDTSVFVCVGGAETLFFSAFCCSYVTTFCSSYVEWLKTQWPKTKGTKSTRVFWTFTCSGILKIEMLGKYHECVSIYIRIWRLTSAWSSVPCHICQNTIVHLLTAFIW